MQARLGIRIVAVALAGLAYLVSSYWLMTRTHETPWNAVGVLAPMLTAIAIGAWRAGQRWLGAIAALAIALLCGHAVTGTPISPQLLYLAQHAGIHLFLAVGFGATLRPGHTALITTLARRVHRQFTPAKEAYTRSVTLAWTLYFLAVALVSIALYAYAPFDTWALFANLLTPVSMCLMFGAEYLLRYRLHPEFERTTVADAIRSYMHGTKPAAPSAPRDSAA